MNKNYSKHLFIICVVLFIIMIVLIAIARNNRTDYDVCGIDSAYIVDSLGEEYNNITIDTIVKTDINGNVYRTIR